MKKYFAVFLLIFIFDIANAGNEFLPNCSNNHFKFIDNQLILNSKNNFNQAVFLLKNIATDSIWLDHTKNQVSASAGWGSKIDTGNWSAITLNPRQQKFAISCLSTNFKKMNCKKLLQVCELQYIKTTSQSSYWIVENQALSNVLMTLRKRGFNLQH